MKHPWVTGAIFAAGAVGYLYLTRRIEENSDAVDAQSKSLVNAESDFKRYMASVYDVDEALRGLDKTMEALKFPIPELPDDFVQEVMYLMTLTQAYQSMMHRLSQGGPRMGEGQMTGGEAASAVSMALPYIGSPVVQRAGRPGMVPQGVLLHVISGMMEPDENVLLEQLKSMREQSNKVIIKALIGLRPQA